MYTKSLGYIKMVKGSRIIKQLNYKRCLLPTDSRHWGRTKKKWRYWANLTKNHFKVIEFKEGWYLHRNRTGIHIISGLPF
jgi:hypothetical protein